MTHFHEPVRFGSDHLELQGILKAKTSAFSAAAIIFIRIVLMMLTIMSIAKADDESYIDNWDGDIKGELKLPSSPDHPDIRPIPDNQMGNPQPLRDIIQAGWQTNLQQVCDEIRSAFQQQGAFTRWLECQINRTGELRGKMPINPTLFPNIIYLKYVVPGNHVEFIAPTDTIFGSYQDPIINVDFDIEIKLTLVFEQTINGSDIPRGYENPPVPPDPPDPPNASYLSHPAALTSTIFSIERSRFKASINGISDDILDSFINIKEKLRAAERKLNATSQGLQASLIDIRELNRGFHRGAIRLAEFLPVIQPKITGTPKPLFFLDVSINQDKDFLLRFSHPGTPTSYLSSNCNCRPECGNTVFCNCIVLPDSHGDKYFMEVRKSDGSWVRTSQLEDIAWLSGSALGAKNGDVLAVRMCTVTQWGTNCSDPINLDYRDLGECPTSSGGVGGGNNVTPNPRCVRGLFGVLNCKPLPQ